MPSVADMNKSDFVVYAGGNRHEALMREIESEIFDNFPKRPLEIIKEFARPWNALHCKPPLDDKEYDRQWASAVDYVRKQEPELFEANNTSTDELAVDNILDDKNADSVTKRGYLVNELLKRDSYMTLRDAKEILHYKDGIYVSGGEEKVLSELQDIGGFHITNAMRSEVLATIRAKTFVDRTDFDKYLNILNVKNGLLDIHTRELRPHSLEYLSMSQLPVRYDPKATCPANEKFLNEILDPEDIRTIKKLLGYCLLKHYRYQNAFFFYGSGSNGKSTLIRVIEVFIGEDNVSNTSLQALMTDRFAPADLYTKYVNTCGDLKDGKVLDSSILKSMVSEDKIRAQRKGQQSFTFRNIAKMIFATNRLPETNDDSYAYYRRLVIVRFSRTFEGNDKDEHLIDKLTTEEELSGLLNLALDGLKMLEEDKGFDDTDIDAIREEYKRGASNIRDFVDGECILEPENEALTTRTDELRRAYERFCNERGTSYLDGGNFGKELKELGVRHKEKRRARLAGRNTTTSALV